MGEGRCQSDKKPPSTNNADLTSEPLLFRDLGLFGVALPLVLLLGRPLPFDLLFPPPMLASSDQQLLRSVCEKEFKNKK